MFDPKPHPEDQNQVRSRLLAGSVKGVGTSSLALLGLLATCAYLLITSLRTDHLSLLAGTSLTLPIVPTPVPPWHFFLYAPILLLVTHALVVFQQFLLFEQWRVAWRHLRELKPGAWTSIPPSLPFLPYFRGGLTRGPTFMVRLAYGLMMLSPAFVIVILQCMFLPYHDTRMTILYAAILFLDLGILFAFLATQVRLRAWSWLLVMAAILAIAAGDLWILLPVEGSCRGRVDLPFPRHLQLNRQHLKGLDLRGRDLTCGDFEGTTFLAVDLTGSDLSHANLSHSDLRTARFAEPRLGIPASGWRAALVGADLRHAKLAGLDASYVDLSFADLRDAVAPRLRLVGSKLTDARFDRANLGLAVLDGAHLEGASFQQVTAPGISLRRVHAAGGSFEGARMPFADLRGAGLVWTRFDHADLAHTDFFGLRLRDRGIDLFAADLTGSRGLPLDRAVLMQNALLGDASFCDDHGAGIGGSGLLGTGGDTAEPDDDARSEAEPEAAILAQGIDLRNVDLSPLPPDRRQELAAELASFPATDRKRLESRMETAAGCFPPPNALSVALIRAPVPQELSAWEAVSARGFYEGVAEHLVDRACDGSDDESEDSMAATTAMAAALIKRITEPTPADPRLRDALRRLVARRARHVAGDASLSSSCDAVISAYRVMLAEQGSPHRGS